jgi:fatty acid desaturase
MKKPLLDAAIPRTALRQLSRPNARRAVTAIGLDWVFLISGYIVIGSPLGLPPKAAACVFVGIQMHRLAIMGHDGAHHLISKNAVFNDGISNVFCFFMFGSTVRGYRDWHFAHHRLVGTDRDTELLIKCGWRYSLPKSKLSFVKMFLLDLVGGGGGEVAKIAWASRARSWRDAGGLIAYWLAISGLLAATHHLMLIAIHIGIVLTVFWAVFRVRNWSEHIGAQAPSFTHRFTVSPAIAYIFFPHYTWMHWEHHRFPTVPAHNLPLLREALGLGGIVDLPCLFARFASFPETTKAAASDDGSHNYYAETAVS